MDSPSILVVDDDPFIVEALTELLRDAGFVALAASSAVEAIALLGQRRFTLVLTDLHGIGDDGWACVERVRLQAAATPVGLITGATLADGEAHGRGFAFTLRKPFDLEALLGVVEPHLHAHTLDG